MIKLRGLLTSDRLQKLKSLKLQKGKVIKGSSTYQIIKSYTELREHLLSFESDDIKALKLSPARTGV